MNDEERKEELENEIAGLKQSMEHTGYGSRELRILESLEKELEELEWNVVNVIVKNLNMMKDYNRIVVFSVVL